MSKCLFKMLLENDHKPYVFNMWISTRFLTEQFAKFDKTLNQINLRRTVFDTWTTYLCQTELSEIELFLNFTDCKQKSALMLNCTFWNGTVYMYKIDLAWHNLK